MPSGEFLILRIPSIGMGANVERLGIDKTNTLESPKQPDNVGWYTTYGVPGSAGNSVWVGYNGSSFRFLTEAKIQADVYIETQSGGRLHYQIISKTRYPTATMPMGDLIHPKSRPVTAEWMTLITSGDLDAKLTTLNYDVLVAERVE